MVVEMLCDRFKFPGTFPNLAWVLLTALFLGLLIDVPQARGFKQRARTSLKRKKTNRLQPLYTKLQWFEN